MTGPVAVVIGGAGRVGRGVVAAFRDAGYRVAVVDPAAPPGPSVFAERATPEVNADLPRAGVVIVSLPARGSGRREGGFRPAEIGAAAFAPRLDALALALARLVDGGVLIELGGGALLGSGHDEADLIAGFQRGVHHSLVRVDRFRAFLCALDTPVRSGPGGPDEGPTARAVGEELVGLTAPDRPPGLYRLGPPDFRLEAC